jgi:hypothetical protein
MKKTVFLKMVALLMCLTFVVVCFASCGKQHSNFEYQYTTRVVDIVEGKVNYNISPENGTVVITVFYGCNYRSSNEIKEILTHIITSPEGRQNNLSLKDLKYYEAEWWGHIVSYDYPDFMENFIDMDANEIKHRSMHVNLNKDDSHMNSVLHPFANTNTDTPTL